MQDAGMGLAESLSANAALHWTLVIFGVALGLFLLLRLVEFLLRLWPANDSMKRRMWASATGNDEALSIAKPIFFAERPSVAEVWDGELQIEIILAKKLVALHSKAQ